MESSIKHIFCYVEGGKDSPQKKGGKDSPQKKGGKDYDLL
jgi:hypothetical protein